MSPKPCLLFVRPRRARELADFMCHIEDEVTDALSLSFTVRVQEQDFDLAQYCDQERPDMILFECPGGSRQYPVVIANPRTHADIPRLGLMMQDPHDTSRTLFTRLLDETGTEFFFTICTASLSIAPEWASRAYLMPMFIDTAIFRDYGVEKYIPLSIFGGLLNPEFYPWRMEMAQNIPAYIPTMLYTHPGYEKPLPPVRFPVSGEKYARLLSHSHFSIADTTRAGYLVRKHLEIPACGTILVAPQEAELGFYGFRDMENCILGSGKELYNKIAHVAAHPELYSTIRRNGHDLIHARYGRDKWSYIRDWFACAKNLRPGEMVQQQDVFGIFQPVPRQDNTPALLAELPDNDYAHYVRDAYAVLLNNGDTNIALDRATDIIKWTGHASEPWIVMAVISLLRGGTERARQMLTAVRDIRTDGQQDSCLDPEELALLVLTAWLMKDQNYFSSMQKLAANIHHISLRRMIWLLQKLSGKEASPVNLDRRLTTDRLSIHSFGVAPFEQWLELINRVLVANNQSPVTTPFC